MQNYNPADEYALLKSQIEDLEAKLKPVRAELLATGQDVIEGRFAKVTVGLQEKTSIDMAKLALMLTPVQLASVQKTTTFEVVRYKAKVAVAA